uniref:Hematological and neurological expressed 1 protein-like n=1 Tax=Sinocyclocheilus rhinocerous TaxID=307959 RepID=A0A673L3Q5_9TELE
KTKRKTFQNKTKTVLRPPGGGSNICFGTDEEKPVKKNKMASSIFAEPEDPHAHRRNNPPGGKPTGVLCGEPSAPLRRCTAQPIVTEEKLGIIHYTTEDHTQPDFKFEQDDTPAPPCLSATEQPAAGVPSGRRNPPGGKSSLILG